MTNATSTATAAIAAALSLLPFAAAPAAAQGFSAKSVSVIVGFPPGGGYDASSRLFARHVGKHLPGNPGVVVQNQPGAGSLLAANLLYNTAPKDGSQIAMFASSAAIEPLLGNPQAKFDANKFEWIGNLNRDVPACGAWVTSGIKSWDDVLKRKTRFGASGPAAVTAQHPFFFKNVLGGDIQVIMGLGGTGPIMLAMQRGEVEATCGMFVSSVRGQYRNDFENGNLVIFIQMGKEKVPYFKGASHIYDYVKTPEDRTLTEFVFVAAEVTRPLALPPGTPAAIVETWRTAFDKTMRDPEYVAELQKAKIESDPMNGAATAAAFKSVMSAPANVIERAKAVLTPPK